VAEWSNSKLHCNPPSDSKREKQTPRVKRVQLRQQLLRYFEGIEMLLPLLVTSFLAWTATYLCLTSHEEVIKAATGCVAVLCLVLSVAFAPTVVQLLLVVVPLLGGKLYKMVGMRSEQAGQ